MVVTAGRMIAGLGLGALAAAGLAIAPALGAPGKSSPRLDLRHSVTRGIGSFTPAAADPMLASAMARAGLRGTGFRFTPTDSRRGPRAITVAVRARSVRGDSERMAMAAPATVALAPIAYNLGVAVGWKHFAITGDLAKLDMAGAPGGRENMDVAVLYTHRRITSAFKAISDKPVAGTPRAIDVPSYSVDISNTLALSKRLDLTAGVRYKSERDRLARIADDRRDSQAVYLGTAFRF